MGYWNITIKGHGIHHNNRSDDANVMTRRLVEDLKAKGHEIAEAKFEIVTSNVEDLLSDSSGTTPPLPATD